jgi:polyisoprenoid-binding protein YceI
MIPAAFQIWTVALILSVSCGPVLAASWQSVPAESQLEFSASYEGAEAPGEFKLFDVQMEFELATPESASMKVTVKTASATMNSADIDQAIAQVEWFDTLNFPVAEFHSDAIRHVKGSDFLAEGIASIKGVSKPLDVPFHWKQTGDLVEISGAVNMSRLEFGIGTGDWAADSTIGHTVQVRFLVRLVTKP